MATKRFVLLIIILVLLAGITTPALAKKPDKYYYEIYQNYLVTDCGEFEVWLEGTLYINETVYYDEDGNFVRSQNHIITDDRYYNPQSGKEALDSVTFNWTWGIGVDKVVGVTNKLTIPGEGTILMLAGHLAWDENGDLVFVKGNYGKEDYDKLCAWFAE